jgi:hypothetical protein
MESEYFIKESYVMLLRFLIVIKWLFATHLARASTGS